MWSPVVKNALVRGQGFGLFAKVVKNIQVVGIHPLMVSFQLTGLV
jgi:hypothetical protein